MTLPARVRKLALALHLTVSVGWIGAAIAYLALGTLAATSRDDQTVRAAWVGMERIGWVAIVPLALASLLTGVVMALGTRWGLVRHYWVVISLALTTSATAVLLLHMPTVSALAEAARAADSAVAAELGGDLLHAGVGLVVLLVVQVLNVYKPRGMTAYGRRRRREARAGPQA